MQSKKNLPSVGFVILVITIIFSILFINWALGPLSYEEAQIEETKGHQLAKEGKNKEASNHFLNAAKIEDDNVSTSRRYRCAGTTASDKKDKINYYQLALKYNPNNENAKRELALYFQEIVYVDRYTDGWSIGKTGKAKISATQNSKYKVAYFTSSPEKKEFKVTISLNNKVISEKIIKADQCRAKPR